MADIVEIRADGTELVHATLTFKQAQRIVGGYVEVVNVRGGKTMMLVNEDGHDLGLSYNTTASHIYGGIIVGTVLHGLRADINRVVQ